MFNISIKTDKQLKEMKKFYENLPFVITSQEYKEYIRDKALAVMNQIINSQVSGFGAGEEHEVFVEKVNEYKSNNKSLIASDYILIYNDTTLSQSAIAMWTNEETAANYANGLSISYLIEYGSGLLGESQPDWPVNVNGHNGSWSYIGPDGNIHHTSGIKGRFVYLQTRQKVKENFKKWTNDYLKGKGVV